jgi:hypothetical protein
MFTVQVKSIGGGWTSHSTHASYRDAVDQADMVHGRVLISETSLPDDAAWKYAVENQGFTGDFAAWQTQDDGERAEYEVGAAGVSTT